MKNPDRGVLVPIALMLTIVLATWLGIAGPLIKDAEEHGIYQFLKDWQTLIAGLVALGAAMIAVRPVWRQVAEMRRQSAVQTYEMLLRRTEAVDHEYVCYWDGIKEAQHVEILHNFLCAPTAIGLKLYWDCTQEKITNIENLKTRFERIGFDKWGSIDTTQARHEFSMAL